GRLIANLAADPEAAHRKCDAAEDDRPHARAGADERVAEDAVVGLIHEIAGFAVAPAQHADAAADVGLDRSVMSERQKANRRGERDDAQLQLLLDLALIRK